MFLSVNIFRCVLVVMLSLDNVIDRLSFLRSHQARRQHKVEVEVSVVLILHVVLELGTVLGFVGDGSVTEDAANGAGRQDWCHHCRSHP